MKEHGKIDLLMNNAGMAFKNASLTPFEEQAHPTVYTNFFGTLRLTQELQPLLKASSAPRVVCTAGEVGNLKLLKTSELKKYFIDEDNSLTIDKLSKTMNDFVKDVAHNGTKN